MTDTNAGILLKAISHPVRLKILRNIIISRKNRQDITIGRAFLPYKLSPSSQSNHLEVIESAGFIYRQKKGRFVYLHLNEYKLDELNKYLINNLFS